MTAFAIQYLVGSKHGGWATGYARYPTPTPPSTKPEPASKPKRPGG